MNLINNKNLFQGPKPIKAPPSSKVQPTPKENQNKMAPGLHQLVIGNWLASRFPIQVDANQGPRGARLLFWVAFWGGCPNFTYKSHNNDELCWWMTGPPVSQVLQKLLVPSQKWKLWDGSWSDACVMVSLAAWSYIVKEWMYIAKSEWFLVNLRD